MAAACLLPAVLPGISLAAPPSAPQAGYWWLPEPVSGLIPVPGVPSNGLYVASSPSGPQAESAVRLPVTNESAYVLLTLNVSNQERVGTPAVVGYPATSKWQTGGPQPWSARPSYRASATPAKGVFSDNGTKMTIAFPAQEAATGVVLVPDPRGASSTFSVSFAPPASDAIRMSPTPHPSVAATRHHVPPSPGPTHRGSPSSSPTTRHHPSRSTTAAPTTPASPRSSKPPSATPSHAASPTPSAAAAPAIDHDHPARDVIVISAIVVGLLLILFVWRASRRE